MTTEAVPDDATRAAVAACRADLPDTFGAHRIAFGFDGFLDTVRVLIDERRDADSYDRVERLADLGDHVVSSAAQNSSVTFEWITDGERTGGHVPHLSRALGTLGYDPTMVGRFGRPPVDRFREEFADRDLLSVGDPGRTDAVEFDDGKLLLAELGDVDRFTWQTIVDRAGLEALADRFDGLDLLGIGYWVDTPRVATVLDGLRTELFPTLSSPPDRILFDPGDVRQIGSDRVAEGIDALGRMDDEVPVTLSANRSETEILADRVAPDTGTRPSGDTDAVGQPLDWSLDRAASVVRKGLEVTRVVGHAAETAVAASNDGVTQVTVPRVANPELTTSAGDHFNAGLIVGLLQDMDDDAALVAGCSLAGHFVRSGTAPSPRAFRSFVSSYLDQFDA